MNPTSGVRCVVFDISGTTMDHGSLAPVEAFVTLFSSCQVAVTEEEARAPMGLHKRDHLAAMISSPAIRARWEAAHGATPDAFVLDDLYLRFPPLQQAAIDRHLDVLPGVPEVCAALRSRGIKIGSTTGFESGMMGSLKQVAKQQGYSPDCWMTPDQCGGGRPAPWMMYEVSRRLGVYPLRHFVKVGDTAADIAEARNAGCWAVGITRTGNEVGLSEEGWNRLAAEERSAKLEAAGATLRALGAHYVIEGACDLLPVITEVSQRIARGERP